jgi:hypothetical protein
MALSYICQKAKTIVVLVVCFSQPPELRWLPHMDKGRPPLTGPYGPLQVHTEDYYSYFEQYYVPKYTLITIIIIPLHRIYFWRKYSLWNSLT